MGDLPLYAILGEKLHQLSSKQATKVQQLKILKKEIDFLDSQIRETKNALTGILCSRQWDETDGTETPFDEGDYPDNSY